MNKQQLVDAVGERLGDRKTAAVAVETVLDTVAGALAGGERVSLFGFGVFEKVDRAARTARNPATGGTVQVPATSVPRFRAGQALKDAVNGRSSRADASARAAVVDTEPAAKPSSARSGGKASEEDAKPAKGTSDAKGKKKAKGTSDAKGKGKSDAKGKGKKASGKGK